MRNDECALYIRSKKSGKHEVYQKRNGVWMKTSMKGNVFEMTSEQVLSHILPALVPGNKLYDIYVLPTSD